MAALAPEPLRLTRLAPDKLNLPSVIITSPDTVLAPERLKVVVPDFMLKTFISLAPDSVKAMLPSELKLVTVAIEAPDKSRLAMAGMVIVALRVAS